MHETFLLVLGLVGLLTIASLLLPIANRINFPYTVLLAVAGCILGGIVLATSNLDPPGILGDFLISLEAMDITSEVVFFVFLPALIFESALNINARHLMTDIGPILLLAILGLLISTMLVGVFVWSVSGLSLVACLLLGAIVSATDPVAIVAIFKNLGAPKRLTILVEGESLFNDATAIVLFTILVTILLGNTEAGIISAAGNFLEVFFGGILVGLFASWLVASLIGRLRNLPLVEITLTICLAYLSFLLAEHYLHVSGVMAVVTAGLVINSFGRTQISPHTWHTLTETWEELVFWANSLIFFLVGLIVPKVLVDFTMAHFISLIALIFAAFTARTAVLYLVLPLINRVGLGQQISIAFRTVMLWGGLRGAVSLALALVILETPGIATEIKTFIASLVTGFVLFTLFVNAPTMGMMMRIFGLDRLPPTERMIRNRVMALSIKRIREGLERAAHVDNIKSTIATGVADIYEQRLNRVEHSMSKGEKQSDTVTLSVGLSTLTNHERHLYLKRFSDGLDSAKITRSLLFHADDLQDGLKISKVHGYQEAYMNALRFGLLFRMALWLQRHVKLTRPLAIQLANRFEVLSVHETAVTALIDYSQDKIPPLFGESLALSLDPLLTGRLKATQQALDALRLQYPEYAETLQKRHLVRVALRLEEASYHQMLDENIISPEVFNDLARELDKRNRIMDRQPKLDLGLEPTKLVAKVPFFTKIGAHRISEIASMLMPRLVVPGERIINRGEPGTAMYFISSGAVEATTKYQPVRLGSGDFFGELALLTQEPRSATVTAISYCQLLVLQLDDFNRITSAHPYLQERITEVAGKRLDLDMLIAKVPLFTSLDSSDITAITKQLKPRMAAPGEKIIVQGESGDAMFFIAAGNVEVTSNQQTSIRLGPGDFFGELALLTRETRNADVIAIGYCELLVLPKQDFYLLLETQPTLKARLNPREDGKQS
ncbi:cation:proton antiporter [Photobacterium chitinilyticum]|uniref:Sodium:proton antiporter n=1 Tax=Photobacterium chitinilyticum TaxID=2485123 RepID=A0A3S3UMT5_9GAMM|nr:cation:proton antiporter [Photobacterium chitinilyticum]RWX56073.1 sodium:proton antiporter [Photobacterium chitinilyticum]